MLMQSGLARKILSLPKISISDGLGMAQGSASCLSSSAQAKGRGTKQGSEKSVL